MRDRLSYSNVMATIAVFIALGGGAWAAVNLPKNSVKSKQIKNKTIKSKDLKKNSVNGAKVSDDSITGADVDESTLEGVDDAETVNGSQIEQISYTAGPDTGPQQLFSIAGLTVTAACPSAATDSVTITASTDTNNSIISLENQVNPAGTVGTQAVFNAGAPITIPIDDTTATMAYGRGAGASPVVTASFLANQLSAGGTNGQCKVVGTVVTDG